MWVFDGEEWTQDSGGVEPTAPRSEPPRPRYDEHVPELQVIEIVPTPQPRRKTGVPPLPLA